MDQPFVRAVETLAAGRLRAGVDRRGLGTDEGYAGGGAEIRVVRCF
jgi:hypothetical protein